MKYCYQRVCMSVCSHMSKTTFQTSQNFLYMLPVAVAQSSSDDVMYFQFCEWHLLSESGSVDTSHRSSAFSSCWGLKKVRLRACGCIQRGYYPYVGIVLNFPTGASPVPCPSDATTFGSRMTMSVPHQQVLDLSLSS